jgi:hypothetical protein
MQHMSESPSWVRRARSVACTDRGILLGAGALALIVMVLATLFL